jgi:hypothetical protein
MVFTIEPMINAGTSSDKLWAFDNWTSVTVVRMACAAASSTCRLAAAADALAPLYQMRLRDESGLNP